MSPSASSTARLYTDPPLTVDAFPVLTPVVVDDDFTVGDPVDVASVRESADRAVRAAVHCRTLNFAVALIGLILALPLMLVIAVAIKLTSPGPVLFTQRRIGIDRRRPGPSPYDCQRKHDLGGKPFTMYKFRTMRNDPETGEVWATPTDPRITPLGRFLRAHRLDELPQLINVIRGEMNIVGPRPEQPEIFQDLRVVIAGYQVRQRVLPGITGWAQIHQSYDRDLSDVERKVSYDIEYIQNRDPLLDLRIMMRTMPVMAGRKGGW
jgi:lipopolysaccharide/colanic/teichoic acid biosynthesis glycosyltransferase